MNNSRETVKHWQSLKTQMLSQLRAHLSPEVRGSYRALDRLICSDSNMHLRKQQLKSYCNDGVRLTLKWHTLQMSINKFGVLLCQCEGLVATCIHQWLSGQISSLPRLLIWSWLLHSCTATAKESSGMVLCFYRQPRTPSLWSEASKNSFVLYLHFEGHFDTISPGFGLAYKPHFPPAVGSLQGQCEHNTRVWYN